MNMERPSSFGVLVRGEKKDLLGSLEEHAPAEGLKAWKADYDISRPGDHVFMWNLSLIGNPQNKPI